MFYRLINRICVTTVGLWIGKVRYMNKLFVVLNEVKAKVMFCLVWWNCNCIFSAFSMVKVCGGSFCKFIILLDQCLIFMLRKRYSTKIFEYTKGRSATLHIKEKANIWNLSDAVVAFEEGECILILPLLTGSGLMQNPALRIFLLAATVLKCLDFMRP